jgi:short-subunit dehydrogenase
VSDVTKSDYSSGSRVGGMPREDFVTFDAPTARSRVDCDRRDEGNPMSKGTILITGASSGLGAEMARQFAALGYDLALCARRTDRLEELRSAIAESHPSVRVELQALDVTDDDAVFAVFKEFAAEFGTLDRVVVNAGLGKGAPLGTGRYDANRQTAMTNFVAALAQTEAAMEIFRAQGSGHLVMISSISALRGMRKTLTTYAATKAGVAALAEGLQNERVEGVDVSIIYPGYIRSEMNERIAQKTKGMVDTETGVRSIVDAIEKRKAKAYVPAWPWLPVGTAMKSLPMSVVRKLS